MDLESGKRYWPPTPSPPNAFRVPDHKSRYDVVIIGGGLSGALIAHTLSQADLHVALIDKRGIAQGSTSASTALIQYEIDVPLSCLILMRGRRKALRSYELCREAISALGQKAHQFSPASGFTRRPSLYLARQGSEVTHLQREFQLRRRSGMQVELLGPRDLAERYSFSAPAAIRSDQAAEVNPVALAFDLIADARKRGLQVFMPLTVWGMTTHRDRIHLHLSSGQQIIASKVIVAAGFESNRFWKLPPMVRLKSSYVMVTSPVPSFDGWQDRCLIWDTGRPYFYLRTTPDRRLMIGGGDIDEPHPGPRDALLPSKCQQLLRHLKGMFPDMRLEREFGWAGTFGDTRDGLPLLGTIPNEPRLFFALCYGANGTNFASIAADLARDWVLDRRNPDRDLFSPQRGPSS